MRRSSSTEPRELLAAFERSGDGVYAVDHEQRIVFWNRGAERILGHKEADVLGLHCYDLIAGGDYAGHPFCGEDCPVIECARRGHAPENYDVRTHTAAGEGRWINVSIVVLRGRGPRSTIAVHLFRDVTAKRRAERRLQQWPAPATADGEGGDRLSRLTRREAEVLQLLSAGMDNARIAGALGVSPVTVRNHIERLIAKLGVHSRLEAVVYAANHGMA